MSNCRPRLMCPITHHNDLQINALAIQLLWGCRYGRREEDCRLLKPVVTFDLIQLQQLGSDLSIHSGSLGYTEPLTCANGFMPHQSFGSEMSNRPWFTVNYGVDTYPVDKFDGGFTKLMMSLTSPGWKLVTKALTKWNELWVAEYPKLW